jgi:hypothetical protein
VTLVKTAPPRRSSEETKAWEAAMVASYCLDLMLVVFRRWEAAMVAPYCLDLMLVVFRRLRDHPGQDIYYSNH